MSANDKSTEMCTRVIKKYLDERAKVDALFAVSYAKPHKNLKDCTTYIINMAKKSGACFFSDDEIYSFAVDYYDEDDIKVGSPIKCRIVVNGAIELTEEEKAQARKEAVNKLQAEQYEAMKKKNTRAKKADDNGQMSLF